MRRRAAERLLFGDLPMPTMTAGLDEAGRGPLAGDVFAAAVILDPARRINGLADSKTLSPAKRESLALRIREKALAWSIASASVSEIDQLNILQATMLAMKRAFEGLGVFCEDRKAELVLVDGNCVPKGLSVPCHAVVRGDALHACISAASILAKTARDAQLVQLHNMYPEYGFDQHKGYGTALHLDRLRTYGPCPIHRNSFAPVRSLLGSRKDDILI